MQDHAAFVQKDLQGYLDKKDFHSVFTKMVESILEEKPDNPVLYMVQHLLHEYPHETTLITQNMRTPGADEGIPDTPRSGNGNEDDSDEDEEDDDASTSEKVRRKQRAMAISGESLNPNDIKELLEDIPIYEKSVEVSEALQAVVAKSPFLGNLSDDQQQRIVSALKEAPGVVPTGEDIIKQGEFGDVLYLLEKGEVDVFRIRGGEEELMHTYDPGSTFGELAILYNSPRAATCRARTDCTLWTLDRYSFKVLALAACIQRRELYMQFLAGVPVLTSLSTMELMALSDAMREIEYPENEVVCTEGERGDFFYIIKEGEAIVTQHDPDTDFDKVIAALKPGKFFGEIALITNKHRTATVRSAPKQTLKVLTVGKSTA
jgi:cAMP-dependent protein kinase regulator